MKRYVLGFYLTPDGVILIYKYKPAWAANKWNGLGGIIEEGESPVEAMVREFEEEAGVRLHTSEWAEVCLLEGITPELEKWSIVVFVAEGNDLRFDLPREIDEGLVKLCREEPHPMDSTAKWLVDMLLDLKRHGMSLTIYNDLGIPA